jgi:hypothetical protein
MQQFETISCPVIQVFFIKECRIKNGSRAWSVLELFIVLFLWPYLQVCQIKSFEKLLCLNMMSLCDGTKVVKWNNNDKATDHTKLAPTALSLSIFKENCNMPNMVGSVMSSDGWLSISIDGTLYKHLIIQKVHVIILVVVHETINERLLQNTTREGNGISS